MTRPPLRKIDEDEVVNPYRDPTPVTHEFGTGTWHCTRGCSYWHHGFHEVDCWFEKRAAATERS